MQTLSAEWLRAADDAVRSIEVDKEVSVVIEQRVVGGSAGDVTYSLVVRDGTCRIVVDDRPEPDVTITTPWEIACELASGRARAQQPFLHGRIRIGGDVTALLRHRELAASVAAALASVS
jgi:predicted lipid carrier protein YhbT